MVHLLAIVFLCFAWVDALAASNPKRPIVYSIAGSDSGGGAGIQADLHAIHAMGGHACTAITCLTAQNSVGVDAVHAPPVEFLRQQLTTLAGDLQPKAVKIGMLGTRQLAEEVGGFLEGLSDNVWVVVDPVMISTSGSRLLEAEAESALITKVFSSADVLTPNKFEAEALLDRKITSIEDVELAAQDLLKMGPATVLIKGGHTDENGAYSQDYLLARDNVPDEVRLCDAAQGVWLRSPRFETMHTHGTGCTLSSSIATALALGSDARKEGGAGARTSIGIVDACCLAKAYVTAGIYRGTQLGKGPGPVEQTSFPCEHQHFPAIATDPRTDPSPFLPMQAYDGTRDGTLRLGRILPIVDSVEWVKQLCSTAGIEDIQLRIKGDLTEQEIAAMVRQAQAVCAAAGVRLWINDYWSAAAEAGCFGVHVGQEDLFRCLQAGGLERIRSANMAVGISTHSYGELSAALGVKPSYISLGPIFATGSKKVQFDPQGLSTVQEWRALIPPDVPLVVIGGIGTAETAAECRKAGAECVAVIGAVTQAKDPAAAVAALNSAMSK